MATSDPGTDSNSNQGMRRHVAGALDIRNVIGGLMLIYGVILVVMGLLNDHDNLWTGIGMLVVGVFFVTWARLKPTVVPETTDRDELKGS